MVTSLFKYEKIRTTDAKAKELRRWGDKLVTLAKRGDLHARRQALSIIRERAVVKKLFDQAPGRFGEISGGYTRVVKLGRRPGDAASMSLVALVVPGDKKPKKSKKKTTQPTAQPKPKAVKSEAVKDSEEPVKEVLEIDSASPAAVAGVAGETIDTDDTVEVTETKTERAPSQPLVEKSPQDSEASRAPDDADTKPLDDTDMDVTRAADSKAMDKSSKE
jgi:large subunit ribosomal protein L17